MLQRKFRRLGSTLVKKNEVLGRVFNLGPDDVLDAEVSFVGFF